MTYKVTVKEFAQLAADAYNPTTNFSVNSPTSRWRMRNDLIKIPSTFQNDFYARFYLRHGMDDTINAAVLAYRGTLLQRFGNDISDLEIALHNMPRSMKSAIAFYILANNYALKHGLHLYLTGHSLGGALAQLVAIKSNPHPTTVVFNSPGIGDIEINGKKIDQSHDYSYIHNFDSRQGVIHKVGTTVGSETNLNVNKVHLQEDERLAIINHAIGNVALAIQEYHEHKMVNVLAAINKEPNIANEMF